jgi:uridylate kinase
MKRILLKISGEGLGSHNTPFDFLIINRLVRDIFHLHLQGIQIAIVVGGGNLFRGAKNVEIERTKADHVGMLATMMNGLILQEALSHMDVTSHVVAPYPYTPCIEPFSPLDVRKYLDQNHVVICTGGTGSPYFTTDTAAVLRALEFKCDALLKGTNVDGVYDKDPRKFEDAVHFDKLTFEEVIEKRYQVMDLTAFTLAKEGKLPIVVFSLFEENALSNIVKGEGRFSVVS